MNNNKIEMTLEKKIELFKKFASHHDISFSDHPCTDNTVIYCQGQNCSKCCIDNECNDDIFFSDDEIKIVKEKFPEYFI